MGANMLECFFYFIFLYHVLLVSMVDKHVKLVQLSVWQGITGLICFETHLSTVLYKALLCHRVTGEIFVLFGYDERLFLLVFSFSLVSFNVISSWYVRNDKKTNSAHCELLHVTAIWFVDWSRQQKHQKKRQCPCAINTKLHDHYFYSRLWYLILSTTKEVVRERSCWLKLKLLLKYAAILSLHWVLSEGTQSLHKFLRFFHI